MISIYNDGPSVRPDWKTNSGIGLRNTRERLALLYGDKSSLELANFQNGVRLLVRIPLTSNASRTDVYEHVPASTPAHPAVMQ